MSHLTVHKAEESPYKAVNQYISQVEKYTYEVTNLLLHGVSSALGLRMSKARDDHKPLVFKGRIQYSPSTGKPITMGDWRRLEAAITKFLNMEKDEIQKKVLHDALWLGNVIRRLDKQQRTITPLGKLPIKGSILSLDLPQYHKDVITASEQLSGNLIQNVNDRARSKIQTILADDVRQRKSSGKVFQDLWDQEADINRDWDRVVRSETAANVNNGYLMTLMNTSDEEHVFVKGVAAPNACSSCKQLVDGVIAVVVSTPPKNGFVRIKGVDYPALWPGKSNIGRKPSNYWVASTIHPHCRCTWSEWFVELEKYF